MAVGKAKWLCERCSSVSLGRIAFGADGEAATGPPIIGGQNMAFGKTAWFRENDTLGTMTVMIIALNPPSSG